MKEKTIICILTIAMLLLNGCAVSDYLTGNIAKDTTNQSQEDTSEVIEELDTLDSEQETKEVQPDEEISDDDIQQILKELKEESDQETQDQESEDSQETTQEEDNEEEEPVEEIQDTSEGEEETKDSQETTQEEDNEEEEDESQQASESIEDLDESEFIKINVKETETVRLKPKAKDADEDIIRYTFSEPLNSNGEWKTEYGDAGKYYITVTASDGKLDTTKNVLLTVEKVNVAPIITGINDITTNEGQTITIDPKVTDPNGDKVNVQISEPVGNDGVWEIGYQKAGTYNLTVTASDGEKTSTKSATIIIKRKNVAPEIKGVEDITVKEGETVKIEPEITDINGDEVTVSISDPVGDDGIWETDFTDKGEYDIKIIASDSESSTTKNIKVVVEDVNKAPEIIDIINE